MRILQLVNAIDRDQLGGMQRYVGDLAGTLVARGHDVTVATKRVSPELPERELLPSGVQLIRLRIPERGAKTYAVGYPAALTLRTARLVGTERFDIVHAHFGLQGFGCRLTRRPYAYTFHAPAWAEITEERGGRYAWSHKFDGSAETAMRVVERTAVKSARERIVLSEFMSRQLELLAGDGNRPHLIRGGVDTGFFSPGQPDSLRNDLWSRHAGPVLFCARRLVPRTGVEDLVNVLPGLLESRPDLRVAIAGTGFLRDRIARRITQAGLSTRVRLLGRLSNLHLRDWYRRASLAVVPSARLEGFGLATAEALACGTPVVGTPVAATPELLRRIDSRLIARGTSPAALREALDRALAHPRWLHGLGTLAAALVRREWSFHAVADRHESLYAGMLAPHDRCDR